MAQRWIIHVDLDAFFASVEELLQPALRGKPLIVGGNPNERGVVSSASYAARAYGVRSAMPVAQALRLCPQAIVVPPRHGEYSRRSRAVMDILREITPAVEQISIDEAFLDVTGCERLWGPVREIGELIQRRVMDEQRLPVSLGIATNRLVAKIACDLGKPKGLVLVEPGTEAAFLAPLPIERLWGVGQVTGGKLRKMGIATIGDLAGWPEAQLARVLGEQGRGLALAARGVDESPLHISRDQRSISQERTFVRDVADEETLQRVLSRMSERVAARLRERHLVGQTVRIKLRYPDFTTITRQVTMPQPTDQGQLIYDQAWKLLGRNWHAGEAVRLLGVAVSGLLSEGGYQLGLFDQQDQRRIRLNRTLDDIRSRFGDDAIQRASWLEAGDDVDDDPPKD
ncbi:MAG: DNA polymerase IV [Chloroflexi bacterium]|jgi:DNA polymerase-4|nr:DNA polymerase IV [Chloroflexota bacterium]